MPFHLSDTELILIVLAAIYLFECACWVRREVVCLGTVLRRFRPLPSPSFLGNERDKLVMGNPSPLARCFLCESWPISLSPEGIGFPQGRWTSPDGEPIVHLAFDALVDDAAAEAITAVEKELLVNGHAIARCASETQAKRLAAMLQEVAATVAADRGRVIGAHLDRWTDHAAAAETFAELKRLGGPLRMSGFMLFVLTFVAGPAMYFLPWQLPLRAVIAYFVLLFSNWMLIVWDYSVCRKKLLGEKFSVRFRHVGMLLLSPASAMRSPEVLMRNGLAAFHPLASAAALCTKKRFAALARPMMLALEYPTPAEIPSDPAACRIAASFRKKLLKRLKSLLRRMEIDPAELLGAAEPLSDSRSYCPRCHSQFVFAEGTCPDCGGIELVEYKESSIKFVTERS